MALADLIKKMVPVKKGDDVRGVASHERMNALQDAIRAICRGENVVSGENIRKKIGENFVILSAGKGGGRGAAPEEKNLQLYDASDQSGPKVGITFGTVAGLVPSGWFAYLTDPEHNLNPYVVTIDNPAAAGFIWAEVTVTNPFTLGIPQSVEFYEDPDESQPNDDTHVYLNIGTYKVLTDPVTQAKSTVVSSALGGSQALISIVETDGDGNPFSSPFWIMV